MSATAAAPLSRETPVTQVTMEFAKEDILENMFYRFSGSRPELETRLRSAFKKKYGVEMMDAVDMDEVRAIYLESPPGQGKTVTHEAACREFAELMGMRFIKNPSLGMVSSGEIGVNDFVYTIVELAGETSNKEVAGLMTKMKVKIGGDNGTQVDFMGHLPDWRLAATTMAGYGYCLFDDFPTATHQVQNSMLGLLLNGKTEHNGVSLRDLAAAKKEVGGDGQTALVFDPAEAAKIRENASSVHLGMAGNRGVRDGNKIFPITTATATRVQRYDVHDTLEAFCERALRLRNDAIGDAGLSGFMRNHPEMFYVLAKQEQGMLGQSATSRSWDAALTKTRIIFHKNGGLEGIANKDPQELDRVLYELQKKVASNIGDEIGLKVAAYYRHMFIGAAPVAQKIIQKGEVDTDFIQKKYNKGNTPEGMDFGYSLASSLATFANAEMTKIFTGAGKNTKKLVGELPTLDSDTARSMRTVIRNFAYGVNQFEQGPLRSFAINQFMSRLHIAVPELFVTNGNYRIPTESTARALAVGFFFDNTKHQRPEFKDDISQSLSQKGGFEDIGSMMLDGEFSKKVKRLAQPT